MATHGPGSNTPLQHLGIFGSVTTGTPRCTIPRSSGRSSRTSPSATRGRVPAPPHPSPAPSRPDRIGSGARRTPSCRRREVAFVLSRPVRRSIDGGGLSGLACRSPWPARSTREAAADVHCDSGSWLLGRLLGRPASESGTLCQGDGGYEWGDRPPEGVDVDYALFFLYSVRGESILLAPVRCGSLRKGRTNERKSLRYSVDAGADGLFEL